VFWGAKRKHGKAAGRANSRRLFARPRTQPGAAASPPEHPSMLPVGALVEGQLRSRPYFFWKRGLRQLERSPRASHPLRNSPRSHGSDDMHHDSLRVAEDHVDGMLHSKGVYLRRGFQQKGLPARQWRATDKPAHPPEWGRGNDHGLGENGPRSRHLDSHVK
jgi:hypothetical protein